MISLAVFLASSSTVSAHFQEMDGSVSALVHIIPDDSPIVGEKSVVEFAITDSHGKFDALQCNCSVSLRRNGSEIVTVPLSDTSSAQLVFPQRGVYELILIGTPKDGSTFQPFSLSYDVRVSREQTAPAYTNMMSISSMQVCMVLIILLIAAVAMVTIMKKRK